MKWALGGLVLILALILGSTLALRGRVQDYYVRTYQPIEAGVPDVRGLPVTTELHDVPILSTTVGGLANTVALEMLLAQQGVSVGEDTLAFWVGSTFGASPIPRRSGFGSGQDAEPTQAQGLGALGLERRYFTSDDSDRFLLSVRTWLSKGRAVRVAVDRAMLREESGVTPYALVIVGYDASGFSVIDPLSGSMRVTAERLQLAEASLSLALQYPWRYQWTIVERNGERTPPFELAAALERNGRALIGQRGNGASTGAALVEDTAKIVERHGVEVLSPEFLSALQSMGPMRRSAALSLRALFPGSAEQLAAADHLVLAASAYDEASKAWDAKQLELGAEAARRAAAEDREAGAWLTGAKRSATR